MITDQPYNVLRDIADSLEIMKNQGTEILGIDIHVSRVEGVLGQDGLGGFRIEWQMRCNE